MESACSNPKQNDSKERQWSDVFLSPDPNQNYIIWITTHQNTCIEHYDYIINQSVDR